MPGELFSTSDEDTDEWLKGNCLLSFWRPDAKIKVKADVVTGKGLLPAGQVTIALRPCMVGSRRGSELSVRSAANRLHCVWSTQGLYRLMCHLSRPACAGLRSWGCQCLLSPLCCIYQNDNTLHFTTVPIVSGRTKLRQVRLLRSSSVNAVFSRCTDSQRPLPAQVLS